MYRVCKFKIIFTILIISFMFPFSMNANNSETFITVEGVLKSVSSEPLVRIYLETKEGDYLLEGDLKHELNNFQSSDVEVKITGVRRGKPNERILGFLYISAYTITEKNASHGFLRVEGDRCFLITREHLIYEVVNKDFLLQWSDRPINRWVILWGKTKIIDEYHREIKVTGFLDNRRLTDQNSYNY